MIGIVRRIRRRQAGRADDAGLTLLELIVAGSILVVLAATTAGTLIATLKTTRNASQRSLAANLASREVEIVSQIFANGDVSSVQDIINSGTRVNYYPLQGGVQGRPLVVDNVPFTVTDVVAPQPLGPGASACNGGSTTAHPSYTLTVTVTWPGMTRPVVNETVLTPPKGLLTSTSLGYVAVKVTNASGGPTSGIPVTISGPGGTHNPSTDSTGCAVTQFSAPGTYTASLNTLGYVDFYGNPTPTVTGINVATSALTVVAMTYDQAAQLRVTMQTASGYALPATLPYVTIANSGLQPYGVKAFPSSGVTTTLNNLWPFTSGYTAWAGSCDDADPAANGASRTAPVVVAPGGTGSTTVWLTPVDVTVTHADGSPVSGALVTATDSGSTQTLCQSDKTLTLGVTDAMGHLAVSVPYGNWTFAAAGGSTGPLQAQGTTLTAQVVVP